MSESSKRRERALAVYEQMGWGENAAVRELDPDLWSHITDHLFGEIWARPGLSLRERELITLAVLMSFMTDGIMTHMRRAHHLGITFDEMKEVVLHAGAYLGTPVAIWSMRRLKQVQAEHEAENGAKGGATKGGRRKSPSPRAGNRGKAK